MVWSVLHAPLRDDRANDGDDGFADAVLSGLSAPAKSLPSRFLYDARGSALFEEITRLPEYYPTRTEMRILTEHAAAMMDGLGRDAVLVEFGSGSSLKTERLLAHAPPGTTYVPVDVSDAALAEAVERLAGRFPKLEVRPIVGDFSQPIALPDDLEGRPLAGFFPGSTIGNFGRQAAVALLRTFGLGLSGASRLIVGADLKKDVPTLVAAYNDSKGVTAAFNLNLLRRINRELGADFDLDTFRHVALYNREAGRMEMHLESTVAQNVKVLGRTFRFAAGERIHTENSHKFSVDGFRAMGRAAGWKAGRLWTDAGGKFSVHEFVDFDTRRMADDVVAGA